jgi:hypothetical protein
VHVETPGVDNEVKIPAEDDGFVADMDIKYGPCNHNHDLQPHKLHDDSHLCADLEHTALTLYNIKKGLKIFREAGAEAVVKKMKQLHDHAIIQLCLVNILTQEETKKLLQYLMFLKKK